MSELAPNGTLLNTKELAKKLNVPPNTIYYWVSRNEIPYIKAGKHNRFNYQEVITYLKEKMQNEVRGFNDL
jgi:excisionase family DNA binding protein